LITPHVLDEPDELMVNASEDQENGDGHVTNHAVPLTATTEDTASNLEENAKQISNLLSERERDTRWSSWKARNSSGS